MLWKQLSFTWRDAAYMYIHMHVYMYFHVRMCGPGHTKYTEPNIMHFMALDMRTVFIFSFLLFTTKHCLQGACTQAHYSCTRTHHTHTRKHNFVCQDNIQGFSSFFLYRIFTPARIKHRHTHTRSHWFVTGTHTQDHTGLSQAHTHKITLVCHRHTHTRSHWFVTKHRQNTLLCVWMSHAIRPVLSYFFFSVAQSHVSLHTHCTHKYTHTFIQTPHILASESESYMCVCVYVYVICTCLCICIHMCVYMCVCVCVCALPCARVFLPPLCTTRSHLRRMKASERVPNCNYVCAYVCVRISRLSCHQHACFTNTHSTQSDNTNTLSMQRYKVRIRSWYDVNAVIALGERQRIRRNKPCCWKVCTIVYVK